MFCVLGVSNWVGSGLVSINNNRQSPCRPGGKGVRGRLCHNFMVMVHILCGERRGKY